MSKKIFDTGTLISIGIGIGVLIIIAIIAQSQTNAVSVSTPDPSAMPELNVSDTFADFGTMRVDEERSKDILITNTGKGPLILSRVRTSCGCTIAELTMKGRMQSFNMEMHNSLALRSWTGSLAPGESAALKAIYRPSIMPVQGPVERTVFFDTNDPKHRTVSITLRALVR